MNIKHKIALTFTGLTAFVIILMGLDIYLFVLNYSTEKFFERLDERAMITAKAKFDKDLFDAEVYEKVRFKYLHTLPDEKEYIYRLPVKASDINEAAPFSSDFAQRAVDQGQAYFKKNNLYGTALRYTANMGTYIIVVTARDIHGVEKLFYLRRTIIITVLVMLLIVYTLGYFYSWQILKPIKGIINEVKNIKASNLDRRIQVKKSHHNDELGELAKTYNDMLSRLETSFAVQTRFVNHASHELKNPLTAILGKTEVASNKDRTKEEYIDALNAIGKEAGRLKNITLNLLQLSRISSGNHHYDMEPVRIDEVLFEIRNYYAKIIDHGHIKIHFDNMPDDPVYFTVNGNRNLLHIALSNLIENGIKFSGDPLLIMINISVDKDFVIIKISDYGIGIPEDELTSVFETFHRGKNSKDSQGHGIGLSLTKNIADIHQGTITVHSKVNEGTVFTISLPVTKDQSP